jgi:hypothetical protein
MSAILYAKKMAREEIRAAELGAARIEAALDVGTGQVFSVAISKMLVLPRCSPRICWKHSGSHPGTQGWSVGELW